VTQRTDGGSNPLISGRIHHVQERRFFDLFGYSASSGAQRRPPGSAATPVRNMEPDAEAGATRDVTILQSVTFALQPMVHNRDSPDSIMNG
jgi:hypothetical protein